MVTLSTRRPRHDHRHLLLCGRRPLRPLPRRALGEGGHRHLLAQGFGGTPRARTYACRTALGGLPSHRQFF